MGSSKQCLGNNTALEQDTGNAEEPLWIESITGIRAEICLKIFRAIRHNKTIPIEIRKMFPSWRRADFRLLVDYMSESVDDLVVQVPISNYSYGHTLEDINIVALDYILLMDTDPEEAELVRTHICEHFKETMMIPEFLEKHCPNWGKKDLLKMLERTEFWMGQDIYYSDEKR